MEYQVIVVGGGPAGYTAAEAAGKAGLRVLLIEKGSVGGVCLNEGCIPTKTLLYSAKTFEQAKHASRYGVNAEGVSFDLSRMVARKNKVVRKLVLGIKARLTACGVTLLQGEAEILDSRTVACGGETYTTGNLLLCTGSQPSVPPIPGLNTVAYWTHREALECKVLPSSLAIIGGGVIGMELAAYFNSLGTEVTVYEAAPEILPGMDGELAALLRAEYAKRGVCFRLSAAVSRIAPAADAGEGGVEICCAGETSRHARLLVCTGRKPSMGGYGLERLGLALTERGTIQVDEHMRTSVPGVYACGDLTGRSMLAHTAVREAEVAVADLLERGEAMSYRAIPAVVYTNPELAGVGETEASAAAKGLRCRTVKLPMAYSGRFVAENEGGNGLCKLLVDGQERVIGAHVLGNPASEIIALAGTAIGLGLTVDEWKRVVFPHPTVGEIFRELLG